MNPTFFDKLYANFSISFKRLGVVAGGIFSVLIAWFLTLPQTAAQCTPAGSDCTTQAKLLSYLPLSGSTISIILGFIVYYLSIHPQGLPTTSQVIANQKLAAAVKQPPIDDAFVAIGSERFSDRQVQTTASLTAAVLAWNAANHDDVLPLPPTA